MKLTFATPAVALLALVSSAVAAAPAGKYVEARTASVYAGACHYNGERVTEGKSAVMAWSIENGSFNGTDLAGVKVMAVVGGDANLADPAPRKAEIIVDAKSDAAVTAAGERAKAQADKLHGDAVTVRRGPVTFSQTTDNTAVAAPGVASLTIQPMPDAACCSQPFLVWYSPLAPIEDRRVGYTVAAEYTAGRVNDAWKRADENSAFYGRFGDTTPAAVASAK